eukprot:COSAG01_NODE_5918_length_3955_cov_16.718102_1_plen_278_part_00
MADDMARRWRPGSSSWEALPNMTRQRDHAVAVALGDGRVLVAGGGDADGNDLASAEVLAADGSGWSAVAPMHTARLGAAGGLLPGGQMIVAGGRKHDRDIDGDDLVDDRDFRDFLATAELYDPVTNVWTELAPMATDRSHAAGCVLPDGRFAVVGGYTMLDVGVQQQPDPNSVRTRQGRKSIHRDGEVYDPETNVWMPLPGLLSGCNSLSMSAHPQGRWGAALVPVAGGMLILGGVAQDGLVECELWDEDSQRWWRLPYGRVRFNRSYSRVVAMVGV